MTGAGTTALSPYIVSTAADLASVATYVNAGNSSYINAFFIQSANIDLTAYTNWTPIGNAAHPFAGNYNGAGFTINNLTVTSAPGNKAGLFGVISSAILSNIGIEIGTITASGASAYAAGIVASSTESNVIGCYNKATITNTGTSSSCFVGGIIGYFTRTTGTVYCTDCANYGAINANQTTTGAKYGGGVIGYTTDSAYFVKSRLFNSGAVTTSGSATVKAICGAGNPTLSYFDNQTSLAVGNSGSTGLSTSNCQGMDVLLSTSKMSGLGATYWIATGLTSYPVPSSFAWEIIKTVIITIGGVDYTNVIINGILASLVNFSGFSINEDITTSSKSASFSLFIRSNLMPIPKGGQECIIYNGTVREFAGVIMGPTETNPAPDIMCYQIQVKDYEFFFNKRMITNTFYNRTLESMIDSSIVGLTDGIMQTSNLSGANFTGNHIYKSGIIMSTIKKFDHIMPTAACNELANYIGFFFYIDYNKDIHFEPVNNTPSPIPGNILYADTAAGSAYYSDLVFTEDVSQLRNQIYFIGHKLPQQPKITQQFQGDGKTTSFSLLYEPKHSINYSDFTFDILDGFGLHTVYNNALDVVSESQNNSDTAYVYYSRSTVRVVSAPHEGDTITVTYYPMLPTINEFNEPDSIDLMKARDGLDGIYEFMINDPKLSSTDTQLVSMRALYELKKYGYPHITGTFNSYVQGWHIGQYFYLTSDYRMGGIFQNSLFYVVKLTKTLISAEEGSDPFMQYQITFSDTPFYI